MIPIHSARAALRASLVSLALFLLIASPAWAGKADVINVAAVQDAPEQWTFNVTVSHADDDKEHWADWWRVRTPDGRELGRRVLLHSHFDEQPFTRDERITIPRGVTIVVVEAHDKVHGVGGKTITVDLSKASGPGYTVKRLR